MTSKPRSKAKTKKKAKKKFDAAGSQAVKTARWLSLIFAESADIFENSTPEEGGERMKKIIEKADLDTLADAVEGCNQLAQTCKSAIAMRIVLDSVAEVTDRFKEMGGTQ